MKPTAQPIRFLSRVITNASLIDLYLAFTVSSCLMIYKLEKLLDQGFKVMLLLFPPLEIQSWPPCAFGFLNCINPSPQLQNSTPRNPLSVGIPRFHPGYFLETPNIKLTAVCKIVKPRTGSKDSKMSLSADSDCVTSFFYIRQVFILSRVVGHTPVYYWDYNCCKVLIHPPI